MATGSKPLPEIIDKRARVLVVAGSDSGGGAGIQADIKTITVLGGYAMTAVSALTAQNTLGVHNVLDVPAAFVTAQMHAVLSDIGADVCKTGMLQRSDIIEGVCESLETFGSPPWVADPVMVAKGGAPLLQKEAVSALLSLVIPKAYLLTPNMPEAAVLMNRDVETLDDMKRAADFLMERGANAVLLKGGHGNQDILCDLLATGAGFTVFETSRVDSVHTHGTGCTLASAIATYLARGSALEAACEAAIGYVQKAILAAPRLGQGQGPLGHMAGESPIFETSDEGV
jgi:hydroxymethylpyrimidine/phosphomethylpyrimidine kinase